MPRKGLAVIYNPLDQEVAKTIALPYYHTGLTGVANIRQQEGKPRRCRLDRKYRVEVP